MTEFIRTLKSENTGGGIIVDLIVLKNGVTIGISDECVCVYPTEEHYQEGIPSEDVVTYFFKPEEQM